METVVWTEALSVGVERIDEQHKKLVAMLGQLQQAVGSGQGQCVSAEIVAQMRQYAKEHFKTEEEAMTASRYPGRTSHVAEHDSFIEKVLDVEDALGLKDEALAKDILDFLLHWLAGHIQGPDKVLGEHLVACGQAV
jgi:hemerythrin